MSNRIQGGHETLSLTGADEPQRIEFPPGELVASRYRIVRFIAAGATGRVYEAEDLQLEARIALKVLHFAVPVGAGDLSQAAAESKPLARFMREVNFARRVTHANVCRVFDVGLHPVVDSQAAIFLTMELLDGGSLAQRIGERGRLREVEALPIVREMCAGLHAAHRGSVVHRDFKSANVCLTRDAGAPTGERAVVTDFGLAADAALYDGALTGGSLVVGSPDYMAPEQIEGARPSPATDCYAVGVVLYEMMTGERPFTGDPLKTAVRKLKEKPREPRELVPEIDRRWNTAIVRCLSIDPAARFATLPELLAAIERAPRSQERRWVRSAVVAAGVALVVAGAASNRWRAASPERPVAPAPLRSEAPEPARVSAPPTQPTPASAPPVIEGRPAAVDKQATPAHRAHRTAKRPAVPAVAKPTVEQVRDIGATETVTPPGL